MAKKDKKQAEPIVKLRLVLDVDYIPNGVSQYTLKDMLVEGIANRAAGEGLMTCATAAEVKRWHAHVEDRK